MLICACRYSQRAAKANLIWISDLMLKMQQVTQVFAMSSFFFFFFLDWCRATEKRCVVIPRERSFIHSINLAPQQPLCLRAMRPLLAPVDEMQQCSTVTTDSHTNKTELVLTSCRMGTGVLGAGLRPPTAGGLSYQRARMAGGAGKVLLCPWWVSEMVLWKPWVSFQFCCWSAVCEPEWVTMSLLLRSSPVPACLRWMFFGDRDAFFPFFFLFSLVLHLSEESPEARRGFWGSVCVVRISIFLVKGRQATETLSDNLHRPAVESFQTSQAASILS